MRSRAPRTKTPHSRQIMETNHKHFHPTPFFLSNKNHPLKLYSIPLPTINLYSPSFFGVFFSVFCGSTVTIQSHPNILRLVGKRTGHPPPTRHVLGSNIPEGKPNFQALDRCLWSANTHHWEVVVVVVVVVVLLLLLVVAGGGYWWWWW